MKTPDQGPGPDGETNPGVGRRRFLSVGGGLLAGAGTLSLPRPGHSPSAVTTAAPPAPRGLPPIYPADPRYATMRMGFNRRWVGSPAYIQVVEKDPHTAQGVAPGHDSAR